MRYLKYIFGFQLLLGSIGCFYYSVYWAGFLLLIFASIILIPLVYKLLKKKISGFKAGCLIFSVFFIGISWFCVSYLMYLLAPVDNTSVAKPDAQTTAHDKNIVAVYAFEQSINNATQTCFSAYDKAFSKEIKYQEEQCGLINDAQRACNQAQNAVNNITILNSTNKELFNLLSEAKTDAKNSLQSWETFFTIYNNQCVSKNFSMNATEVKLHLVSAVKNMYFMTMKIKKAKSLS